MISSYLCESFAHPLGYFSIGVHDLFGEDPPSGFKTPSWEDPSRPPHGDELVPLVSSFVGFGSCISLCFEDLAHVCRTLKYVYRGVIRLLDQLKM